MDKLKQTIEVNETLIKVIEDIIKNYDAWDASLLLKSIHSDLNNRQHEAQSLIKQAKKILEKEKEKKSSHLKHDMICIYISLYQSGEGDLKKWRRLLMNLEKSSVGRPIYRKESDVKKLIRTHRNLLHEGYAVVTVSKDSILDLPKERVVLDRFGHEQLALRLDAIQSQNIVKFIHANRYTYTFANQQLILQDRTLGS